jgi:acyl-CoA reductase-like NAD-dependent aldehyde dehydrogenase
MLQLHTGERSFTTHIERKKSKVDYNYHRDLSEEEKSSIEKIVNDVISQNLDVTENSIGITAIIKRVPIGPILGITPFNFPINLVAHKLSPALACGNTFILKPASSTPISSFFFIKYAVEAGFDNGIIQFLPLKGSQMKKLIEDNRIKKISFTGSPKIGWNLKKECGRKKISLELGGNGALIIEDINNINKIVSKIITGGFAFSGQVCISVQRVYINEKFYNEVVELLKIETEKLIIGDPLDEKTDIGPMITLKEAERVLNWIEDAVESGGKILVGGKNKALATGTNTGGKSVNGVVQMQSTPY